MNNSEKKSSDGFHWGPFTTRIPFKHFRVEWNDFLQGLVVAGSTALALIPLLMNFFGLSLEEAVAMGLLHSILITSHVVIFGEPYAPGWVTPALPLVLAFVLGQIDNPQERFQMMTVLAIELSAILLFLGVTGLAKKLFSFIPQALKAGIIMGAGFSALKRVFVDDADKLFFNAPFATGSAILVCFVFTFSASFGQIKQNYPIVAKIAAFGLLPGFAIAAIVGPLAGEIQFDVEWGFVDLAFASMWQKTSPLHIGWAPLELWLTAFPLALVTYVILFGDLLTGNAIIKEAQPSRPDNPIDINVNRSHISLGIRNAVMSIIAPFFPTQGTLWTGVHAIIVQEWKKGKDRMESLHGGIISYYSFGVPVYFVFLPFVTALKPLMPIALALTLVLTGFVCAYIAQSMVKKSEEQGVAMITAFALVFFTPWVGISVGVISSLILLNHKVVKSS